MSSAYTQQILSPTKAQTMKIAAITMVHKDYWALAQWYSHYGQHLGTRNLFVISHGYDPEIENICPEASIITIPRDELRNFDRVRMRLMNGVQSGLLNIYDWVIQTDTDELVCFNPLNYSSFEHLFQETTAPALFALGLDLAEVEGDKPLGTGDHALSRRKTACVTGHYSKAWAVRKALPLKWHGVFCGYKKTEEFPFEMPLEVFFVHLKYANSEALSSTNAVRKSVADSVGDGWSANGWANPDRQETRFYKKLAAAEMLPWDVAIARGYKEIRENPVRDPKRGIVKSPVIDHVFKTELPAWFAEQ